MNHLRGRWDQDLSRGEIETEKEHDFGIDKTCRNLVMNMLKITLEFYDGGERAYVDKEGDELVNTYKISK